MRTGAFLVFMTLVARSFLPTIFPFSCTRPLYDPSHHFDLACLSLPIQVPISYALPRPRLWTHWQWFQSHSPRSSSPSLFTMVSAFLLPSKSFPFLSYFIFTSVYLIFQRNPQPLPSFVWVVFLSITSPDSSMIVSVHRPTSPEPFGTYFNSRPVHCILAL